MLGPIRVFRGSDGSGPGCAQALDAEVVVLFEGVTETGALFSGCCRPRSLGCLIFGF